MCTFSFHFFRVGDFTLTMSRYYSAPATDHFYTTAVGEIGTPPGVVGNHNYAYEGIIGYVQVNPDRWYETCLIQFNLTSAEMVVYKDLKLVKMVTPALETDVPLVAKSNLDGLAHLLVLAP